MAGYKAVFFFALLATLGCRGQARSLAQAGDKPSQCTGPKDKVEPSSLRCHFKCDPNKWRVSCRCQDDKCSAVTCKVDKRKNKGPHADLNCTATSAQLDCGNYAALSSLNDSCVVDTVKKVLAGWKPAPNPNPTAPSGKSGPGTSG